MNDDFLISIKNSKDLEEKNINLNKSKLYCYWCDKEELEKTSLNIKNNYSHISCFFSLSEDKLTDLVNNAYILIFIKNPKILYGIIKVDSIIIKNLPEKNYLEDEDIEYKNKLINNKLIKIELNEFTKIVEEHKLVEVPKMFIVRYENLYYFNYEIGIKKFNDFINKDLDINSKIKKYNFKYPNKVQNKELKKCCDNNLINNLKKYIDYLNLQDNLLLKSKNIEESINISEISDISETSDTLNNKKEYYLIPVLWNGCKIIKEILVECNSKPNKKLIQDHYLNCSDCEINDNNNKQIDISKKKIVIKNIDCLNNLKIFDYISNKYNNNENIISTDLLDFNLDKGKINIISCKKSSNIYNKCLFIIE